MVGSTAPVLVFEPDGDAQLSARVTVNKFDVGVLFVHRSGDSYAKLCFGRSSSGDAMVESVLM